MTLAEQLQALLDKVERFRTRARTWGEADDLILELSEGLNALLAAQPEPTQDKERQMQTQNSVAFDSIQLENVARLRRLAVEGAIMFHRESGHEALFTDCQSPDCYLVRRDDLWPVGITLEPVQPVEVQYYGCSHCGAVPLPHHCPHEKLRAGYRPSTDSIQLGDAILSRTDAMRITEDILELLQVPSAPTPSAWQQEVRDAIHRWPLDMLRRVAMKIAVETGQSYDFWLQRLAKLGDVVPPADADKEP